MKQLKKGDKNLIGNKGLRRFLAKPEGDGFSIEFELRQIAAVRAVSQRLSQPIISMTWTQRRLATVKDQSNAIEFKRRIKTQTVLPCAETAAMMFPALLASGQITMRKVDAWQTLSEKPTDHTIDLAASSDSLMPAGRADQFQHKSRRDQRR